MLSPRKLPLLLLVATLPSLGCHAQTGTITAGKPLPMATARRVEVLLRQKATLPPDSTVQVGVPSASEIPGYDTVALTFTNEGKVSRPINFLISTGGKTLAQFNKFDISADPRNLVSAEGRPSRGGPATAPVLIVGFDDLECPYCARLHESIFPAITQRYGDKVHIVYRDFPLDEIHPWAMRAAIDVNCLAEQSGPAYWNAVDAIHAKASGMGTDASDAKAEKTLDRANMQLDKITQEQAAAAHLDAAKVNACIAKQDKTGIAANLKLGTDLGVGATPALFINGDKIDGAVPIEFIFGIIDDALRARNLTPPPTYVVPGSTTPPAASGVGGHGR